MQSGRKEGSVPGAAAGFKNDRGRVLGGPGAPQKDHDNGHRHFTAEPWWARPPHLIRTEDLDLLDRALRRGVGVVETIGNRMVTA